MDLHGLLHMTQSGQSETEYTAASVQSMTT